MNEKALGCCRGLLLAEGVAGVAPQKRDAIFREKLKIGAVEENIVEKWHKKARDGGLYASQPLFLCHKNESSLLLRQYSINLFFMA